MISFIWDLTDGNGHTFDSTNFLGVFTVDTSSQDIQSGVQTKTKTQAGAARFQTASLMKKTLTNKTENNGIHPDGGSPSASAIHLWAKEPNWTPNDNWVVAYGLFSANDQNDINMIVGGPGGEWGGVLGTLDRYGLSGNVSPGNSAQSGTVFTLQDESSRTNLLNYLADHRYENFYFFGHGNNSAIGSYNGFNLTLDQIAFALLNVPLSYVNPHVAEHPYRFVFIDACDTGKGNFCESLGIPAQTLSTNNFAAQGVESRAFVGFKSWNININFVGWMGYSEMTGFFLDDWLSGNVDVKTCVQNAQNNVHGSGVDMDGSAVIYGAYDLTHNAFTRPQ